jgi:hypothetical protein
VQRMNTPGAIPAAGVLVLLGLIVVRWDAGW